MGALGDGHEGEVDLRAPQFPRHLRKAGPGREGVLAADELELAGPGPELEQRSRADHAVPLELVRHLVDVRASLDQDRGLLLERSLPLPGPPASQPRQDGQDRGGQEEPEGDLRARHASRMP